MEYTAQESCGDRSYSFWRARRGQLDSFLESYLYDYHFWLPNSLSIMLGLDNLLLKVVWRKKESGNGAGIRREIQAVLRLRDKEGENTLLFSMDLRVTHNLQ